MAEYMKILETNNWRTIWNLIELFGMVDGYGGAEFKRRTQEGLVEGWLVQRDGDLWVAPRQLIEG
jgi:hypothetical protein